MLLRQLGRGDVGVAVNDAHPRVTDLVAVFVDDLHDGDSPLRVLAQHVEALAAGRVGSLVLDGRRRTARVTLEANVRLANAADNMWPRQRIQIRQCFYIYDIAIAIVGKLTSYSYEMQQIAQI